MADSDPISESTPHKRRKLNDGKGWDSHDDSSEEFTVEDFETQPTLPIGTTQKRQLQYSKEQLHSDLQSSTRPLTYVTQPTQTLKQTTQLAQPLEPSRPSPPTSDVLVDRSSPTISSPLKPKAQPQPIRRAPFAKPGSSLLASAIAPPGTSFRQPLGIQSRPKPVAVDNDDESEEDPPVYHSSDEETQGLSSNLKPTNFKRGDRGLDSTPNRDDKVVKESPRIPAPKNPPSTFSDLLTQFNYPASSSSTAARPAYDMASSYASSTRAPRQQLTKQAAVPASRISGTAYNSIDDIPDYTLRRRVGQIQEVFKHESVQRCIDALKRKHGNVEDAVDWLTADEEQDAPGEEDELASDSPVVKRGVAYSKGISQSSQPVRPAAKQEVKAPTRTIAERWQPTQPTQRRQSTKADELPEDPLESKPRKRLLQGRKAVTRSSTPPSSPPPQPPDGAKAQAVVISDDESDSGLGQDEEVPMSSHETRLLKFFNECTSQDLAELIAQPEDVANFVLNQRPFDSLDAIQSMTKPSETKTGTKSTDKKFGSRVVELCSDMWTGYDAVDELVEECERIAKPIQDALKGWGVGTGEQGEVHLMNLDDAHDSGIGTPASSCPSDDAATPRTKGIARSRFLSQPESMNSEAALKDYQLVGLNWLNLLWSKKLSCILADDMGLGKTCQVIAFLAHLQEQNVNGVHLVIVPGSTLENWLREFAYFAPQLNVVPYYGSQTERPKIQYHIESNFDAIDVVVTTYDMAVKPDDNRFLRKKVDPMVCVYDEAHALRNPESNRYGQLTRISAEFRILLTGTPLQNNLQELVAILAFIMPDLFADKQDELKYIFQHKASTKDADHTALLSAQRVARARSMMTPFILRRKKQQVLDLPAKHSRIEFCEMTVTQANNYADLLEEAQAMFADKGKTKKATSNMIMALRKAAIHPLLDRRIYDDEKIEKILDVLLKKPEYAGNPRERTRDFLVGDHHQSFKGGDFGLHTFCANRDYLKRFKLKSNQWMDAGKIAKFRELVTKFIREGARTLVFSQFTTMMNILEAVMEDMDVKFMRLDGSTNMQVRQDMIDKFTKDESISVFMLSTKAGGAGINLASANKVIIFDSGFNPQDDIQAENRAHRVGQTREVEVVRLVTRGTIEEQIHALGESKLALDDRVAGEGATAADEKQVEKEGEQLVQQMFLDNLKKEEEETPRCDASAHADMDLKDAFKNGLEGVGLRVASKQARY